MALPYVIRPEADVDFLLASSWYDEQRLGLGDEFRADFMATLDRVTEFPHAYPNVHGEVRRALMKRFPYAVYYVAKTDVVVVLATVHHSRDETGWEWRL